MIVGVETCSRLITRFTIFEGIYLRRKTAATADIEAALLDLYSLILGFFADAVCYFATPTGKRIVRSIFTFSEPDSLRKFADHEAKVVAFAKLADAEISYSTLHEVDRLQGLLNQLQLPITRITNHVSAREEGLSDERFLEILRWYVSHDFILG